jgi:DNA-binding transcriptional LysR family regulator
MAGAIADCRHQWPDIELVLVQDRTLGLVEALTGHTVDIAIVRPPLPPQDGIALEVLASEGLLLAVHRQHRLARRRAVDIGELVDEGFISHGRQRGRAGLHDLIEQACQRAGFARVIAQYAPQYASGINLVAAALGVAIVPACMRHLRTDAVAYLPLRSDPPLVSEIAMASRAH